MRQCSRTHISDPCCLQTSNTLPAAPTHAAEEHGKAHSITDAQGRVMRFCQQCSKLQPLELFMGDRRSCAASLDKRECAAGALQRGAYS